MSNEEIQPVTTIPTFERWSFSNRFEIDDLNSHLQRFEIIEEANYGERMLVVGNSHIRYGFKTPLEGNWSVQIPTEDRIRIKEVVVSREEIEGMMTTRQGLKQHLSTDEERRTPHNRSLNFLLSNWDGLFRIICAEAPEEVTAVGFVEVNLGDVHAGQVDFVGWANGHIVVIELGAESEKEHHPKNHKLKKYDAGVRALLPTLNGNLHTFAMYYREFPETDKIDLRIVPINHSSSTEPLASGGQPQQ